MMCTWEARPSGRPGGKIHCKIHGSRSMQEAIWKTTGKPDEAGRNTTGSTYTGRPV